MKNIAIIPARSGSKGLKDKNIKLLGGKPLMAYTIEEAKASGQFEVVHVSTDSEKYARIAGDYGADVPFLRDENLAGDTAGTWDVLRAVLRKYEALGKIFDVVTLLQPTSPLRDAEDIRGACELFEKKDANSVVSVCMTEHSPLLCNTLDDSLSMKDFIDMEKVGRRQGLPDYYRLNGAIYIQKAPLMMESATLYGDKSYAYIMKKEKSVDIDDAFDFLMAEAVVKSGKKF
ncbi:MAG: acylneuraminate cytidylyltransferase family protein [Roseburia sp.]|nr:acylneuraminate cytidylyltransferase family protein [Roseburia sp.]